jgi:hypothetical protein
VMIGFRPRDVHCSARSNGSGLDIAQDDEWERSRIFGAR